MYFVYILLCADDTLYTGITNNIERRVVAHNSAKAGAKYTRARRPVRLVYVEKQKNRGSALKREAAIKRLSRQAKLLLIRECQDRAPGRS